MYIPYTSVYQMVVFSSSPALRSLSTWRMMSLVLLYGKLRRAGQVGVAFISVHFGYSFRWLNVNVSIKYARISTFSQRKRICVNVA